MDVGLVFWPVLQWYIVKNMLHMKNDDELNLIV